MIITYFITITIRANSPIKQGTGSMYDPYVMDFEV